MGLKIAVTVEVIVLLSFFVTPLFSLEAIDRAEVLLEEGRNDEALELLVPLLKSENEEELARATELLYRLYYEKGEKDQAVAALEAYRKKFPDTPTGYLYLYWIAKVEEERQNFDRALALFFKLIDTYPEDPNFSDPYNLRCQAREDIAYILRYSKNDYPQAVKAYEAVLSCIEEEEKPRILMEIASCYEKMKDFARAKETYARVGKESEDEFYRRWSELRIQYLTEKPSGAQKTPQALAEKLTQAFEKRDLGALEKLAKKGDFWAGVIFSEFDIDTFAKTRTYFARYLKSSPGLRVNRTPEKKNNDLVLRLENWGDPDYNILYLVIEEGIYGWEWKGIILSSTSLESLSESSPAGEGNH
jgi:tetratricopeptide (TPR) repeat protein